MKPAGHGESRRTRARVFFLEIDGMIRTTATNGERQPAARTHDVRAQRRLLNALRAVARGNFAVRLPADDPSIDGDIAAAFNDVVELNQRVVKEFERLAVGVGRDG